LSTWEVSRLQLCIHTTTIVCRTSVLSAVCRGEQIKELVGVVFSLGFSSVVVHQACAPERRTHGAQSNHITRRSNVPSTPACDTGVNRSAVQQR